MKTLSSQALDKIGKKWDLAKETREAKLQATKRFASFVEKKFGLQNIDNLKPGHVQAYAEHLHQEGISARTGSNYMSAVRDVCKAIGKGGIVARDNAAYGFGGVSRQNPIKADLEKINSIRSELENMAANGNRIAMMMTASAEMREAFGLRHKEALMSHEVRLVNGKACLVVEGAKGGRERHLEIRNEAQINALDRVVLTAQLLGNGNGRIIPPEMSLRQALNAESKLWNQLGGTREAKANMHAMRHTFTQERKEEGATRPEMNQELGHGEQRSLGHYTN